MKTMTVLEWQFETGATGEPDAIDGTCLEGADLITVSDDGTEYCIGHPNGNETWMEF